MYRVRPNYEGWIKGSDPSNNDIAAGKSNKFVTIVASIQEEATIVEYVGDGKGKGGLKDYWSRTKKQNINLDDGL